MARTVEQCYTSITDALVTNMAAAGITINPLLWSNRNLLRAICYSIAVVQSLAEQLQDINISRMEAIQAVSSSATSAWLQHEALKFQYSSTTPQYLTIVGGVAKYATTNEALRIVTACSVAVTVTGQVNVKVAKGSPLEKLTNTELSAFQSYIDQIGAAGITYVGQSLDPDRIYIQADIYHNGLYSSVIQANVIAAIDNYLQGLSLTAFDGAIKTSDIELMIRGIEGVTDVVLQRVSCRLNTQTIFTGIDLVLGADLINRKYTSGAGYMISEDTSTYTLADSLTFIAE